MEPPGLIGKYDGMFMVTPAGKKYPVPDNYAAKSKLIYGDKLKMLEGPQGRQFKHIERIPRVEVEAQLSVKDGRFVAVTAEGSYKLIQSAVRYLKGEEGDKVKILLPREEKHAPFAAISEVVGKKEGPPSRKATEGEEREEKPVTAKVPKEEEAKPTAKVEKEEKAPREKPAKKKVVKEKAVKKVTVAKKPVAKAKPASGGKPSARKGEKVIEPPGEEELR